MEVYDKFTKLIAPFSSRVARKNRDRDDLREQRGGLRSL